MAQTGYGAGIIVERGHAQICPSLPAGKHVLGIALCLTARPLKSAARGTEIAEENTCPFSADMAEKETAQRFAQAL